MKLNIATLALTVLTANANLRGQRELSLNGFGESLGKCNGAVCGMWGDPHMVTCDGLTYDCQGIGIFTLMDNEFFNVQGNFVDVGAREHVRVEGWGLTHGASITNDIMIQFKKDPKAPVFQLGFGDLTTYENEIPSEEGCQPWTTFDPVDMGHERGGDRTVESNLQACRKRCEDHDECTQFSYWADGGCHLNDNNAVTQPSNRGWSRALAGVTGSTCGLPHVQDLTLAGSGGEEEFHGIIRNNCPLLMYVNGTLQDLSNIAPGQNGAVHSLYGSENDDYYVELVEHNEVRVIHKIAEGTYSEMELKRTGDGPGEMWSCHWDFKMCLPAAEQRAFEETTVGLLGTPNGDTQDDWMTTEGETLELRHTGHNRHENTINYCVENWCVSEADSLMTYHGDTSYADYKCENQEHIDWEEDNGLCVEMADSILMLCKGEPILTRYACQLDCCLGGDCGTMPDIITNDGGDKVTDTVYDYNDEACDEPKIEDTGSTVCPNADIVSLLKTKGDEPLPDGADIFYDMSFGDGTVNFKVNNPFEANAKVFVKHDKKALEGFLDPNCAGEALTASDCADDFSVEVACLDFDDVDPFALVTVYFASVAVSPLNEQATIDKCCDAEEYAPAVGIVEYTFEIKCGCPGSSSA